MGEGEWSAEPNDRARFLSRKPGQSDIWIAAVVTYHPNPDILLADVVQEMVGEAVKITATEPAAVKMEKPGVLQSLPETDLELHPEVRLKAGRSLAIFPTDLI